MTDRLFLALNEYNMLQKGDCVTVALSGGADSMCLLHILKQNEKQLGITVSAAHLNHSLRGDESDRDEGFVRQYCQKNDIPLTVKKLDVMSLKQKGEGVEEAARRLRYEFLNEAANGGKIATAHTLSDSAETLILNMTRGTTLSGLCGISPVRDNIIRPIILFTRSMTEEYCNQNDIQYVTDSTNLEDICRRNVIRHNIIPTLLDMNPSFYDGILRLVTTNIKEDRFLSDMAEGLLNESKTESGYDCEKLLKADPVILRRAIKKLLKNQGVSPEAVFIENVEAVILNGGNTAINSKLNFRKRRGVLESFCNEGSNDFCFELTDSVTTPHKKVSFTKLNIENYTNLFKVNKKLAKQSVDFDKILNGAVVRNRRDADKIKLYKRPTKTLKKLYNEYGIPPEERSSLIAVADSQGIKWLEGFGADESARVTDTTRTVLLITVETIHPKE